MKSTIVILSVLVALLLFSSFLQTVELIRLQEKVMILEDYKDHFIHMLNVRDYPEVLGISKEKKK